MGKEWDSFKDDKRSKSWAVAYDGKKNEKVENNGFYTKMRPAYSQNKQDRDNFIAFLREVMTEALRVLKPGGHALIWALPRTSHWTATALEDAGFEVRDKLYHLFGSGFPKSLDISKAIDKMQGAEREYLGPKVYADGTKGHDANYNSHEGWRRPWKDDPEAVKMAKGETKPATPEAQRWQGYGTALKPSCEEWILCRKPLAESSIAAQVLATGTGGLNIGQTRVGNDTIVTHETPKQSYQGQNPRPWHDKPDKFTETTHQGRFPSHLLLSHSLWCVPRGTKRVRGNGPVGFKGSSISNVYEDRWPQRSEVTHGEYEHVEAYDCATDCPIAELDRQSGVRKSGGGVKAKAGSSIGFLRGEEAYHFKHDNPTSYEASEGGASRYFTNFPPEDYTPFLYQAKASRAERNAGCEGLPELVSHRYSEQGQGSTPQQTPRIAKPEGNIHPTVKSLSLMRWLIRLITPPDGIVLDPFCGSGSTCVAAIQEGKHFIGIEQDESYVNIANARIEYARTHEPDVVQVATKKVKANKGFEGHTGPVTVNAYGEYTRLPAKHMGDSEGMEEVEDWDCAPDCPVRILGEQSGTSKSIQSNTLQPILTSKGVKGGAYGNVERYRPEGHEPNKQGYVRGGYTDQGTAARYFQTFAPDLWTQDMHDAEEVFIAEGGYSEDLYVDMPPVSTQKVEMHARYMGRGQPLAHLDEDGQGE